MKVLAVVPARGGSKGVPLKNLRKVLGVPMVVLAGQVGAAVSSIDRVVVSTDHDEIARVAEDAGINVPFQRPESLSGDRVSDAPVLKHALEQMESIDGVTYDIVVMLQPTSPMRKAEHVSLTIRKLVDESLDAVWTVSETDSKGHPLKQLVLQNGLIEYYDPKGSKIVARQQLKPVYHRNGIAYAVKRELLMFDETVKGRKTGGLVIEGPHVSIDTEYDIAWAEYIIKNSGYFEANC